jgi:hypothetical protein
MWTLSTLAKNKCHVKTSYRGDRYVAAVEHP